MRRVLAMGLLVLVCGTVGFGEWVLYDDHTGAAGHGACDPAKWVNHGVWELFYGFNPYDGMQFSKPQAGSTVHNLESAVTFFGPGVTEVQIAWDMATWELNDSRNTWVGFSLGRAGSSVAVGQTLAHNGWDDNNSKLTVNNTAFSAGSVAFDALIHYVAVIRPGTVTVTAYAYDAAKGPADYAAATPIATVTATGTATDLAFAKLYFFEEFDPLGMAGGYSGSSYRTSLGNIWVNEIHGSTNWQLYDDHSRAAAYGAADASRWINHGTWEAFYGRNPDDGNKQVAKALWDSTVRNLESVGTFFGSGVTETQIAWDMSSWQVPWANNTWVGFSFGKPGSGVAVAQTLYDNWSSNAKTLTVNHTAFSTGTVNFELFTHYQATIKQGRVTLSAYTYDAAKGPGDYATATPIATVTATGTATDLINSKLYFFQEIDPLGWSSNCGANFWTAVGNIWAKEAWSPLPQPQNLAFTVPGSAAIVTDGNLSDWTASTEWSAAYIPWSGAPLDSTTRAKFSWNDAQDMLYVAVQTDEHSVQPGGHVVVGLSKDLLGNPSTGNGATQLCFDTQSGSVQIRNEIDLYNSTGDLTTGVQAGYSLSGGVYTFEIAIPLWSDWKQTIPVNRQTLSEGEVVYLYSCMESAYKTENGMNLTWNGNPKFYMGAFDKAAALTLAAAPVTEVPGDANHDHAVDVSDLGILAANYGLTSGATWEKGDFNHDGAVDVSDLGILAANYGTGAGAALDFDKDAQALGLTAKTETATTSTSGLCGTAGIPLIAGLVLAGLLLVGMRFEE